MTHGKQKKKSKAPSSSVEHVKILLVIFPSFTAPTVSPQSLRAAAHYILQLSVGDLNTFSSPHETKTNKVAYIEAPLHRIPKDICGVVWEFLDRSALFACVQVCRSWHTFSQPFVSQCMCYVMFENSPVSFLHPVDYQIKHWKVQNFQKQTRFTIVPVVVKKLKNVVEELSSLYNTTDVLLFVYESKVTRSTFKLMIQIFDLFYEHKSYHEEFPGIILDSRVHISKQINKFKQKNKVQFFQVSNDVTEVARCLANKLYIERCRSLTQRKSLRHRIHNKRHVIKAGFCVAASSLLMSVVFIAPAIIIATTSGSKPLDLSALLFIGLFLLAGLIILCFGTFLCGKLCRIRGRKISIRYH